MSASTPGPWMLIKQSPPRIIKPGDCDICEMLGAASNEGVMADARLIATAPRMLAALQGVLLIADKRTDEFDEARAAIAQATGEV